MVNRIFFTLLFLLFSVEALSAITAELNRKKVILGETVQLSITADSLTVFSNPDISELEKDFDIRGPSEQVHSKNINGKSTTTTRWIYQLNPREAGIYTIAPISVGKEKSQALSLHVSPANTQQKASNTQHVYIELEFDKKEAYVQEQIIMTIKVNDALGIRDLSMQDIKIKDSFIKEVKNTSYQRQLNGKQFSTYEIQYAIFPQSAGTLHIPAIKVSGQVLDRNQRQSLFNINRGKTVSFNSNSDKLNILAPALDNTLWLPAKNLQLHETWSNDPQNLKQGDSITRTIIISANGLTADQLPQTEIRDISGIKFYQDQAELTEQKTNDGITGKRTEKQTLVFTKSGKVTLPEININWFNTKTGKAEQATLPAFSFDIASNPQMNQTTPTAAIMSTDNTDNSELSEKIDLLDKKVTQANQALKQSNKQTTLWQYIAGASLFLNLILVILWFWLRNKTIESTADNLTNENNDLSILLKQLKKACANQHPQQCFQASIKVAQNIWPQTPIHSLADIKRKNIPKALENELAALDKTLANQNQTINYQVLYQEFEALENQNIEKNGLKSLYPG